MYQSTEVVISKKCRNVINRNKVILSEKPFKRIEVVTRALKEIRSRRFRIKLTKDGVLESKHSTL